MSNRRETVITASATLFSELFHGGQFEVPWYQRYYDWTTENVDELLQDIGDAIEENRRYYFLGTILLVERGKRLWEINDGQQRMITVSLICAALCRRFHEEMPGSQREGLALRMLFDLDGSGVWKMSDVENYTPRIAPPENDQMRYRQMIRGNSIGTDGKLTEAWRRIEIFFGAKNESQWEEYFDFVREKLEVACLIVPGDSDPNDVYETINYRGKELDDLDLIRNHIYSHFNSPEESERKESVHESLEKIRTIFPPTKSGSNKANDYMRCRLQCRFGFIRKGKGKFYRGVRLAIPKEHKGSKHAGTTADYVFGLVKEVSRPEDIELFRTLISPNPSPEFLREFKVASGTTNSPRSLDAFLRELRGYTITQPLVFALLEKYIQETDGRRKRGIARRANRNLSRLAAFVLRTAFVAPKFEPSRFETEFSNLAKYINKKDDIPDREFKEFLKECDQSEYRVLDDSRFLDVMSETRLSGTSRIKQFLLGVNRHGRPGASALDEARCSVEHILPKSSEHWGNWDGFRDIDPREWVSRIGNLTLMSLADNKPGNKYNLDFQSKCSSYEESSVAITRELLKYGEWTPDNIEMRQRRMAEIAVKVWVFE